MLSYPAKEQMTWIDGSSIIFFLVIVPENKQASERHGIYNEKTELNKWYLSL
jgi:hypothetical protein